jgi:hypothetical protein
VYRVMMAGVKKDRKANLSYEVSGFALKVS